MHRVRPASLEDAAAVAALYNHYVHTSVATFEVEAVDASAFAQRMDRVAQHGLPWLVVDSGQGVSGYAYSTPWRARAAYAASAESTVYVDDAARGKGVGRALYDALFEELRARSMHVVIAGISLPNAASVALHERMGMHKVAHFEQVGRKFDRWVDVGYWQRTL